MKQSIVHVALVVRDYDEAIEFYTRKLNFTLVEDTYQPEQDKRWVVVAPPGSGGTSLLLARASKAEQEPFIGNQAGGRVFLFLDTDDFWRDYRRMVSLGIPFVREPKSEPYGMVAVFQDLYGNLWDLLELEATSRTHVVELKAGSTVVRGWRREDAEALACQANDRRVWLGLRDAFPHPYGIEDARSFISMARRIDPPALFAIEVSGEVAGGIGYTGHKDVERIGAEIGYWLGHQFWGRGIATTALRLVTEHAFGVDPELRRLWAVPYASNPASAQVLAKAGYRLEGTLRQSALKDGQVLDQLMYAILRDELALA